MFSYQRSRRGTSTAVNRTRLFREQIAVRIPAVGAPAWPLKADVHVHGKSSRPSRLLPNPAAFRPCFPKGSHRSHDRPRESTLPYGNGWSGRHGGSTVLESFSHPVVDHGTRVGHLGFWWISQLWRRWGGAVRLDRSWSNYWSWWHPVRLPLFCRNPPSARKVNRPGKSGQHPFGSKRRSVRLGCLNDPRRRGFGR